VTERSLMDGIMIRHDFATVGAYRSRVREPGQYESRSTTQGSLTVPDDDVFTMCRAVPAESPILRPQPEPSSVS
ncbi:hypothetical protein ABTK14_21725, partial [Acinetobacter baumannii]